MSRDGIIKATFGELLNSREERLPNDGIYPLYSLTIKDGVTPKTERYEREFLVTNKENKKYKVIRTGDLVFNPSNLRWGAIATSLIQFPVLASPIYEVFHPKDDQVLDPYFLGALASSPILMAKYLALVEGTLVERTALKKDDFLEIEIEIPPLPEQKKIAEILSGIDRAIELLAKAIDSHRTTRNALMESIFKDGHKKGENGSSEWRVWTIDELLARSATPMRSGPFGSALLKEELAQQGIPFLGIDNVQTEAFVPTFKRFLTDEKFQDLRRYEVFPQDVMITIMGTVGRSCIVPNDMGQCVSSKHTWTMTFDHSKVAPQIICWQLNHYSRTRTKFLESSQGGVMDAISSQTLRETEVPIPTIRVFAEQIVGHYKSSHNHEQTLNKKFRKMKLLRNAVASDLLSGRERVCI